MKTILTFCLLCISFAQVEAYNFNGKEYNIKVPENIHYYERAVNTNNCDMQTYGCKVAKLNIMLVTRGFKPLY